MIFLFSIQSFGTSKVSKMFSPFMALYFFAIAGMGIYNITLAPQIFLAFNPWAGLQKKKKSSKNADWSQKKKALSYLGANGGIAPLGAAFLSVTGMEALYADVG